MNSFVNSDGKFLREYDRCPRTADHYVQYVLFQKHDKRGKQHQWLQVDTAISMLLLSVFYVCSWINVREHLHKGLEWSGEKQQKRSITTLNSNKNYEC